MYGISTRFTAKPGELRQGSGSLSSRRVKWRAWKNQLPMHLLYRNEMGLEQEAPIQAARTVDTDDGDILLLWVYLDPTMVEFEFDNSSDEENFDDEF